jgi:hypothetical protein
MKAKSRICVPVYEGWVRGVKERDADPSHKYAVDSIMRAEDIEIYSV